MDRRTAQREDGRRLGAQQGTADGTPKRSPPEKGARAEGFGGVTPPLRHHQEQRDYRRAGHLSTSHGHMVTQLQRRV